MQLQPASPELPDDFRAAVAPTAVSAPRLLAWNGALAEALGLPREAPPEAAAWFSGNVLPPGATPVALAYAGHQFGHFVPQLGDGRAILLGELRDTDGRRLDVQLKGAGPTPFSRRGDGRAAIGPVLREFLVSEAMHALGIPSTRALAAVATGDVVVRDALLPGAVLTRVAASHLRVGSFQYAAARGDPAGVQALLDAAIARHDPALAGAPDRALRFLDAVAGRQAALVARWLSVGFIHGVMNTDNMAVSGETLDYGPCAFLDEYDPGKTFSSIDRRGRYAYANQAPIAQWNLARLAECLLPLIDADETRALDQARAVVEGFADRFAGHWRAVMGAKLGIVAPTADDAALVQDFLEALQAVAADFTLSFHALARALAGETQGLPKTPAMDAWLPRWRARLATQPGEAVARLRAANPAVIPRNHQVEAALSAAGQGDLAPFDRLLAAVRRPFDDGPAQQPYLAAPAPGERVQQTFCGT